MKRWYEAFLDGYKPAVLLDRDHRYFEQLKHYPHLTPFDQNLNSYIFFQTVKQTYQHPKAIENPMYFWTDKVETYLSVPYGDYDRLREVRDYIMKQHGLIPTVTSDF